MSRLPLQSDNIEKRVVLENQVLMKKLCNSPVTSNEVAKRSTKDPIISRVIGYVKYG